MLNQVECYKCTAMLSLSRYVTVWTLSNIKCKWNVQAQRFTFIYSTFLCRVVMKIKFKRRKKKRHHSNEKAHALASKRQRFICSVGDASQFLIVNTSELQWIAQYRCIHLSGWRCMYECCAFRIAYAGEIHFLFFAKCIIELLPRFVHWSV